MNNTALGSDAPTLPRWTGPPQAIVDVQAMLFASLAASLFSAFLAMLGKQWLNRYNSTDLRGTVVERSQNRQRKLDGIVVWYFNNVMESLPLMLQAALLLFSCALCRYLWEVDATVASVVLGVTSFGVLSYMFIVIAGAASESCPYQTPGAYILRHHILLPLHSTHYLLRPLRSIFHNLTATFRSIFSRCSENSLCYEFVIGWWGYYEHPCYSGEKFLLYLFLLPLSPILLAFDLFRLGRVILRSLVPSGRRAYHGFMSAYRRTRDLGRQTITLDLRCVSWMLQTSLDKTFHLSALKYLLAIPELPHFDPSLVIGCLNVLIGCVNVVRDTPVMVLDLEQLGALSARCFLRTFCRFFVTGQNLGTLVDLRRRYSRVYSSGWVDFRDLPFRHTMTAAHILVNRHCRPPKEWRWYDHNRPPTEEHIQLAGCIAEVAQAVYQRTGRVKVPRWMLRFAQDSLSLDPPPPPSVVADCLKIIAIDLGCNVRTAEERCVKI